MYSSSTADNIGGRVKGSARATFGQKAKPAGQGATSEGHFTYSSLQVIDDSREKPNIQDTSAPTRER